MTDATDDADEALEMAEWCSACDRKLRTLDEMSRGTCEICAEAEERTR